MTGPLALAAARIFDGDTWHDEAALMVAEGRVMALLPRGDVPPGAAVTDLGDALLVPGYVDLQVNGGGGVLFNDRPSVDGIRAICAAHVRFGTTALLATLITDRPETVTAALAAGRAARAAGVPGYLGLHLEGPHLSRARKGAHDPALIRPMTEDDLAELLAAAKDVGVLMVTVAPESVNLDQIRRLANAGILVSLGHTDCSHAAALACAEAGASQVTHLFNAMSPLGHREPGLVGAALDDGRLSAGLIADGHHVDPAAMRIALRAKAGPGRIFLVTDAMSGTGTDLDRFMLSGREVIRSGGRLAFADGTLAGADIDMHAAVGLVADRLGLPFEEALRMASAYPADAARLGARKGRLRAGSDADVLVLGPDRNLVATFIAGRRVYPAPEGEV
ncbi:N-acetylglucosamine-6-phosphate deacetylase [Methylobrevis pamukkalensis]|uniref:N-acetylglucosamine-6-phosphate deacetylase n=1 Tax=Methylobrevis pamukkalensis TaxID=1439726 RepID=UPI000845F588|nr:N-acetylglucosamine-6-phosphate deacetylase [Methylobrevis pamukkalensis]